MLLGMLKYAQGARVVANIAQTTPTQAVPGPGEKKKTNWALHNLIQLLESDDF